MRSIDSWLSEYKESHQNQVNVAIHKVAVPLIMLSVLGLGWSVSLILPFIIVACAVVFYFSLSISLGVGMILFSAIELLVIHFIDRYVTLPLWLVSVAIFVVAWIFQFIGHAIEGKKPSFTRDLLFLLIGPAWVIAPIFRMLKIRF